VQSNKRHTIDAGVDSTLERLYSAANGSRELVSKAHGVLIFPSVVDAGFIVGAEYGEGSLRRTDTPPGTTARQPAQSAGESARNRVPSFSCS